MLCFWFCFLKHISKGAQGAQGAHNVSFKVRRLYQSCFWLVMLNFMSGGTHCAPVTRFLGVV